MKKAIYAIIMMGIVALGALSALEGNQERIYANLVFTVFELDDVKTDIASKINMPIPEVYTQSWIHHQFSLDISEGELQKKTIEKDNFCFVLTAESQNKLSIQVKYLKQERFYFEHREPSTAHYIFYGPDNCAYLMEVLFTTSDHRTGSMGPGIRK